MTKVSPAMVDTTHPEVSIVVPCYNHAGYLEECLTSIKVQTYPYWRVIVVDDGSSDSDLLQPVIDRIGDVRIRLVRHETNRGPSAARNTGIRESSTDLFVCVDADDRLDPFYLECVVPVLWHDDTLDCVFPDVRLFGVLNSVYAVHVPTVGEILRDQSLPGAGTMMRRRLWERLGGYDETSLLQHGREDWEFYIRAFTSGCKAEHIAEPLYLYRISHTSLNFACRLRDDTVAEYIYDKHRGLFDAAGEGRKFLSFGFAKAARAWYANGLRGRAFLLACRAWLLDPSYDRLKLVVSTMLPHVLAPCARVDSQSLAVLDQQVSVLFGKIDTPGSGSSPDGNRQG